jgi:hypothetical protein
LDAVADELLDEVVRELAPRAVKEALAEGVDEYLSDRVPTHVFETLFGEEVAAVCIEEVVDTESEATLAQLLEQVVSDFARDCAAEVAREAAAAAAGIAAQSEAAADPQQAEALRVFLCEWTRVIELDNQELPAQPLPPAAAAQSPSLAHAEADNAASSRDEAKTPASGPRDPSPASEPVPAQAPESAAAPEPPPPMPVALFEFSNRFSFAPLAIDPEHVRLIKSALRSLFGGAPALQVHLNAYLARGAPGATESERARLSALRSEAVRSVVLRQLATELQAQGDDLSAES